jgi:hypothetical protein
MRLFVILCGFDFYELNPHKYKKLTSVAFFIMSIVPIRLRTSNALIFR